MAKNDGFEIGDLVQLLSGGPVMTVHSIHELGGMVGTTWFSGRKLERATFNPDTLRRASEDKK